MVSVVKKFRNLYKQIGGQPPSEDVVDVPDVDVSKFLIMLQDYFQAMTNCMSVIAEEVRESNGLSVHESIPKTLIPTVSSEFETRASNEAESCLKNKYDINAEQFQSLMEKYIAVPQIQQVLVMLQEQQREQFKQMGIV